MRTPFLFLFLFLSAYVSAQQVLIGRVSVEGDRSVAGVSVYNVATESLTQSDNDGHFLIYGSVGDEIRFIKPGFQRVSYYVKAESFTSSISIDLILLEHEIEEVVIGFRPSGILSKDSRALDRPLRERKLNDEMAAYMMKPPAEGAYPSNKMPSSMAMGPDFSQGQMDLLKLASGLGELFNKATNPTPPANYAQREAFYKRVKEATDLEYYKSRGLDEYDFDIYLAYADERLDLAKKFRLRFDMKAIELELKGLLTNYLDTRVTVQKEKELPL